MIEFGQTLRQAREAKGYTVAQLAELTRMAPSRVEELEKEDFSRIPAAIYGRGFVRLYCEAVGLDPKPLTDEFTDIFNGNREITIRERAPSAAPATEQPKAEEAPIRRVAPGVRSPAAAPEAPFNQPPPVTDSLNLFDDDKAVDASSNTPPTTRAQDLFWQPKGDDSEETPSLSRYAANIHETKVGSGLGFSIWRVGVLAAIALLLIWGVFLGVRALYRVTRTTPEPAAAVEEEVVQPTDEKPVAAAKQKPATPAVRVPAPTKPLYID